MFGGGGNPLAAALKQRAGANQLVSKLEFPIPDVELHFSPLETSV